MRCQEDYIPLFVWYMPTTYWSLVQHEDKIFTLPFSNILCFTDMISKHQVTLICPDTTIVGVGGENGIGLPNQTQASQASSLNAALPLTPHLSLQTYEFNYRINYILCYVSIN